MKKWDTVTAHIISNYCRLPCRVLKHSIALFSLLLFQSVKSIKLKSTRWHKYSQRASQGGQWNKRHDTENDPGNSCLFVNIESSGSVQGYMRYWPVYIYTSEISILGRFSFMSCGQSIHTRQGQLVLSESWITKTRGKKRNRYRCRDAIRIWVSKNDRKQTLWLL
jgi:hypothetical protein